MISLKLFAVGHNHLHLKEIAVNLGVCIEAP
jgi:hypothetical protein